MRPFINRISLTPETRSFLMISVLSVWCLGLLFFRAFLTHQLTFLFLVWNLFLAFIPWVLSVWAKSIYKKGRRLYFLLPILASWLLFFPNAPYILTDLFHLRQRPYIPLWYDLTLILSFAWAGLWMGIISLRYIHEIIHEWVGKAAGWLFVLAVLMASGFGIYVGRYLRWNSWDLIRHPFSLLRELAGHVIHPFHHLSGWGMTIFFGTLLILIYLAAYTFQPGKKLAEEN